MEAIIIMECGEKLEKTPYASHVFLKEIMVALSFTTPDILVLPLLVCLMVGGLRSGIGCKYPDMSMSGPI